MAIFNSALQTLSEMAIMESEVPEKASPDITDELKAQLASYPYLNESECKFRVEMVPVKESKRLGKYLIEAEDLSRYMITNGISSAKQAIGNILHFNELDGEFYHTAIVVDEDSILDEIDNLGKGVAGEDPKQSAFGLGKPMIGEVQTDFSKLRRVSNTKRLLDILTGRYGLPIVKKNYTQVGFLESDGEENDEDVEVKKKSNGDIVIHEKDKDDYEDEDHDDDEDYDDDDDHHDHEHYHDHHDHEHDDEHYHDHHDHEHDDDYHDDHDHFHDHHHDHFHDHHHHHDDHEHFHDHHHGHEEIEESALMDQHELYLQHIRDIAAGKFDDEL